MINERHKIRFEEVNSNNFIDCIDLQVNSDQKHFVATNVFSIAQSKVYPEWSPLCIYNEQVMVGFALFGIDPDDGNVWLIRYMIDSKYQRQGVGKAALLEIINLIRDKFHCKELLLSIEPENIVARKLYESVGFSTTNQIIADEEVFIKTLE